MGYQAIFKRYEIKYILTEEQVIGLMGVMQRYMRGDEYGNTTVCNLYFDTPDYLLVRRSLEKPVYKEKLRLRSYGTVSASGTVFPELKKKYQSVVYKRRLSMSEESAMACLTGRAAFPDTQIGRELAYCFTRYEKLQPRVYLSYDREAFYSKTDHEFRMTFDRNVLWRDSALSLSMGKFGSPILPKGAVLLEVKTAGAIPLWLVRFLSENKIYKTSFSKYGTAYAVMTFGQTAQRRLQSA